MHFVVGQASFTVFVVVLFNLLVPEGWATGLVRLENIALGVGVSVLAGALLWPRGAGRAACAAFAAMLHACGRQLDAALGRYTGRADAATVAQAGADALAARERADAAFEELAHETVGDRPADTEWTAVLALASKVGLVADLITWATDSRGGPPAECAPVSEQLMDEVAELHGRIDADADVVSGRDRGTGPPPGQTPGGTPPSAARPSDGGSVDAVHRAVAAQLAATPPEVGRVAPVLRLGWTQQWLELVADTVDSVADPVDHIGQLARRPWWR